MKKTKDILRVSAISVRRKTEVSAIRCQNKFKEIDTFDGIDNAYGVHFFEWHGVQCVFRPRTVFGRKKISAENRIHAIDLTRNTKTQTRSDIILNDISGRSVAIYFSKNRMHLFV